MTTTVRLSAIVHEIDARSSLFDAVKDGSKTYMVVDAIHNVQKADRICLRRMPNLTAASMIEEFMTRMNNNSAENAQDKERSTETLDLLVTYVQPGGKYMPGIKSGYVVLSIRPF